MTTLGSDSTLASSGTHACEKKASVLIVDDEPQVLVALQDILSAEYLVHAASSPEEALEHAIQHDGVAVVISDQRMPGMTGDELLGGTRGKGLAVGRRREVPLASDLGA